MLFSSFHTDGSMLYAHRSLLRILFSVLLFLTCYPMEEKESTSVPKRVPLPIMTALDSTMDHDGCMDGWELSQLAATSVFPGFLPLHTMRPSMSFPYRTCATSACKYSQQRTWEMERYVHLWLWQRWSRQPLGKMPTSHSHQPRARVPEPSRSGWRNVSHLLVFSDLMGNRGDPGEFNLHASLSFDNREESTNKISIFLVSGSSPAISGQF